MSLFGKRFETAPRANESWPANSFSKSKFNPGGAGYKRSKHPKGKKKRKM